MLDSVENYSHSNSSSITLLKEQGTGQQKIIFAPTLYEATIT